MYKPKSLELTNIGTHKHTLYEFRQGRSVLIVGENCDDSAQPRNGSGKSLIPEGVSIAITGDVIRSSSVKEIVRREAEEDYGIVELILENAMLGITLRIKRTIYRKESQVIELWEDKKQQKYADVNGYNKAILEYLDISKEDFFAFYLITMTNYVPFLRVGDTKKKEIINRFSGADDIDKVNPKIDEDVAEKNLLISAITTQIATNRGKQELLADQIQEEEEKYSDAKKAELKVDLETELTDLVDRCEKKLIEIDHKKDELAETDCSLFQFKEENYDEKIESLTAKKKKKTTELELQKKTYNNIATDREKDFDEIKDGVAEVEQSIKNQETEIRSFKKTKAELETKLAGEIECPSCHHKFILADKEYDVEEGKMAVLNYEKEIEDANKRLVELNEDKKLWQETKVALEEEIQQEQEKIKTFITEKNQALFTLENDIRTANNAKSVQAKEKQALEDQIANAKRSITFLEKDLEELINASEAQQKDIEDIDNATSTVLEDWRTKLMAYMDEGVEMEEKLAVHQEELQKIEEWYTNFKNFKSYLANQSIKNIEDYTNLYLQSMGSNLSIQIDGYKVQSNKKIAEKITTTVLRNGFDAASYGTYSAGERARIDIACILAIQTLINLNCTSGGLDLCMVDEILDAVDAVGIESIVQALENTQRTVLIISQHDINAQADYILKIRKQNKISTIV